MRVRLDPNDGEESLAHGLPRPPAVHRDRRRARGAASRAHPGTTDPHTALELALLEGRAVNAATFLVRLPGTHVGHWRADGYLTDYVVRNGAREFRMEFDEPPPNALYDQLRSNFDEAMRRSKDIIPAMWIPLRWVLAGRIHSPREAHGREQYVVRDGTLLVQSGRLGR